MAASLQCLSHGFSRDRCVVGNASDVDGTAGPNPDKRSVVCGVGLVPLLVEQGTRPVLGGIDVFWLTLDVQIGILGCRHAGK